MSAQRSSLFQMILPSLTSLCLAACGGGPGAFHVDETSIQTQSPLPQEPFAPSRNSAARIERGDDDETQNEDPIFRALLRRQKPTPTQRNEKAPAELPAPGGAVVPGKDYSLPLNTFQTVRVRLFPILESRPQDVFQKTQDLLKLNLSNGDGLTLKNLNSPSEFTQTGIDFEFLFDKNQVVIDGKVFPISEQMSLGLFPVVSATPSWISLGVDATRVAAARVALGKERSLAYRGIFAVRKTVVTKNGRVSAWALINYVEIEDYVRSVVPSEIGKNFSPEAVRAQAIAARTYTLRNIVIARCPRGSKACVSRDWDVDPSTQFQSYLGAGVEREDVTANVASTRGQFLKYDGAPILAMYHSSSGGQTLSAKDYFCRAMSVARLKMCEQRCVGDYPYLQGVVDAANAGRKRFGHGLGLPQWSAQEMAKAGRSAGEIVQTYYVGVSIEQIALPAEQIALPAEQIASP